MTGIEWVDEVGSTNEYLTDLINKNRSEFPDGWIVAAKSQTKGKGQIGNCWVSAPNQNLTFSLLLHPTFLTPQTQFPLSMAVALALVETLSSYVADEEAQHFFIKWPNDIYYQEKKIAGVLIENQIFGRDISHSIVGIGININQEDFPEWLPNPISMKKITGKEYDLNRVLSHLQEKLLYQYTRLKAYGPEPIHDDYHKYLFRRYTKHEFTDEMGIFQGRIMQVEYDGQLMIFDEEKKSPKFYYFNEVHFTDLIKTKTYSL